MRVHRGQYKVLQPDAQLDQIAGYAGGTVSTCSLEISCKLAPIAHNGAALPQPVEACQTEPAPEVGGGQVADAARWARFAPLSLVCLDIAPRCSSDTQDDDMHASHDHALTFISTTFMRHGQVSRYVYS